MKLCIVVAVLAVGCKKTEPKPAPGSASSMSSGSAPTAIDAAVAVIDAAVADAAPSQITIGNAGLSALAGYKRGDKSDEETVAELSAKLPGFNVRFDVMEYADEREEGYYSVRDGETEVAQLFRTEPDGIDTRVIGPMFPTEDGIKTGDKVAALVAKHPDLACTAHKDDELGLLQCKAGGLTFLLDATKYKGKQSGKLDVGKLADTPIYMIVAGIK